MVVFFSCESANDHSLFEKDTLDKNRIEKKQKGVHVFGRIDSTTNLKPFVATNFEWITLVPWSHQKDYNSPTINHYRGDSLERIKRDAAWKTKIELVHNSGLKVFLKPHVWIFHPSDNKWRSEIYPTSEKNWNEWKKNYREFILRYAKIAAETDVELFCIGTELTRLTLEKTDYWLTLIEEVRKIYPGKITYAANWYKEYENISFWGQLDYIGIQAYFPLVKKDYPTSKEISEGWKKHIPKIEAIYDKYNRKILFTELGYKSTPDSATEPWAWLDYENLDEARHSYETQSHCYQAFFNSIWNKEWFVGVHLWQMRSDYIDNNQIDLDFTPQGKPALKIISEGFNK